MSRIAPSPKAYSGFSSFAGSTALQIMPHSLRMPTGYSTRKVLYRSQTSDLGWNPPRLIAKYEYRITSVMLHASNIDVYTGLRASQGKGSATSQTRRKRDEICTAVVEIGARTTPAEDRD